MFSPSIASSTESSAEIRFLYSANSSAGTGRRTNQRMVENGGTGGSKLNRSVTFAKPLVSDVREIDPLDSASSPILAGHPNMYPNLNGGGPAVCRICYSSENSGPKTGEPLISPCNCKGTMGLYHRTCLNKWLAVSNKNCCEICLFKFQIKRVKRSFWEYIRDEDSRAARRSLITDLLCFFLLTPLVLISSIICCISSIQLINEEKENRQNDENGGMRFEIAIGLLFLSAILLIAYAIWIAVTITFHRKAFHSWQSTHWTRTIVDQLSLEESMLVNGSSSASADDSRVRV